eukprot:7266234-Prorocentrum_lima.AAC.1
MRTSLVDARNDAEDVAWALYDDSCCLLGISAVLALSSGHRLLLMGRGISQLLCMTFGFGEATHDGWGE